MRKPIYRIRADIEVQDGCFDWILNSVNKLLSASIEYSRDLIKEDGRTFFDKQSRL